MRRYELPDYCSKVIRLINDKGFEAYVVGGAVRDLICGKEPHDYDMASSARPEQIIEIMKEAGLRTLIETGLKHGTVTVMSDGELLEITTYRCDGDYSDSRHPDNVTFSTDIEEDVKRRDFTMNALYLDADGNVRDCVGGVKDIEDKIIRAVGDPEKRFSEDALRIMRGLRFASQVGATIDPSTREAMFNKRELLREISAERIKVELTGLICGKDASRVIRENVDILSVVIPELKVMEGFDQKSDYHHLDLLEHTLCVLDHIPLGEDGKRDEILSYSALFHDIGKPRAFRIGEDGKGHMEKHPQYGVEIVKRIADDLKFSNDLRENVTELVRLHDVFVKPDEKRVHRLMCRYPSDLLEMLFVLQRADILAHSPKGRQRIELLDKIVAIRKELLLKDVPLGIKDLAINGNDLIALGVEPGPRMGDILNTLLEKVVAGEIKNNCEELVTFTRESLSEF